MFAIDGGQAVGRSVVASSAVAVGSNDATLWLSDGSSVDLFDSAAYRAATGYPFPSSTATGVAGGLQAGWIVVGRYSEPSAAIWTGTPDSMVSLDPGGAWFGSAALGSCAGSQVGYAGAVQLQSVRRGAFRPIITGNHATIWSGTAASMIDLHNSNVNSFAVACEGTTQVGYTDNNTGQQTVQSQASLWRGSRTTQVNLHTGPYSSTQALGISGATQVGVGTLQGPKQANGVNLMIDHAVMWNGAPSTLRDLHPAGFASSRAQGANASRQVGYGAISVAGGLQVTHALAWSGNAASVVDLNAYLPAGFTQSRALTIDASGAIGGDALAADGNWKPVVWAPVP